MVIKITSGASLYGALKYNESKAGEVLLTNEIAVAEGGGTTRKRSVGTDGDAARARSEEGGDMSR